MPHIPRNRPGTKRTEPERISSLAPVASPSPASPPPEPADSGDDELIPDVPELPMRLKPARPDNRPSVPQMKSPATRPKISRVSPRRWKKSPDDIASFLGVD